MGGYEGFEVLAEMKGSEFEFMTAQHPLIDRESVVILGDHVTLDAGTGCVHTAPGHAKEDYEICRKYDAEGKIHIGMTVPVDDHGLMNEEAGKYCGLTTDQANEAIFNDLQACGALYASEDIIHQYAHCWRCKSPDTLPRHRPVVLLRRRLQGPGLRRLRRRAVAARVGP